MSKLENHYKIIEQLSLATGIPVNVWQDQTVVYSKSAIYFPFNIALGYLQEYLNPETPIFILVSSDNIVTGYVYMKEEHAYLLVGPVSHFEISTSIAARICQELDIPATAMPALRTYFYQIPPTPISRFRDTLILAYSILNPWEPTPDVCLHHLKPHTSRSIPQSLEYVSNRDTQLSQLIEAAVKYGKPDLLQKYYRQQMNIGTASLPNLSRSPLRSIKNVFIGACSKLGQIAISGGLDFETSLFISDSYIPRVDASNSYSEVFEMMWEMMIDYAKRVEACCMPSCRSPVVRRICTYISANMETRLSVASIADAIAMNPNYMGTLFKKETGKNLVSYIHERKAREACYLLETTDITLIDLAEKLAFPSQQQFQRIFKEVIGCSPGRYRQENT